MIRQIRARAGAIVLAGVLLVAGSVAKSAETDPAEALQRQATALMQDGNYTGATPLLEHAVQLLERGAEPNAPNLADGLSLLADLYATQSRLKEAELLYRRVLSIREAAPGDHRLDL